MKNIGKQLKDRAKKVFDSLAAQKSPDFAVRKEVTMNIKWNYIAAQWTRFHSKAQEEWGELTESELLEVDGRFDVLAEKIQERYGIEREEAKQQIDLWTANLTI